MDQLGAELVVLTIGGITALIAWLTFQHQKRRDHAQRVWKGFAKRFGGHLVLPEGSALAESPMSLLLRFEGASVTVDVAGLQQPKTASTTVRVDAPATGTFQLFIAPEGMMSSVSKLLGYPDVEVGELDFDETFEVRSGIPDLARAWIDADLRQQIAECKGYDFSIVGGEARATRPGIELSPFQLEKAIRIASSLAAGGKKLLHSSRVLAADIGGTVSARGETWEPDGTVLTVLERRGVQLLLDHEIRAQKGSRTSQVWTRMRARPTDPLDTKYVVHGHRGLEPPAELSALPAVAAVEQGFTKNFTPLCEDEKLLVDLLTSEIRQRIEKLGPALVVYDGREVSIFLEGFVFDAARVSTAMDLAADLASSRPKGPYR